MLMYHSRLFMIISTLGCKVLAVIGERAVFSVANSLFSIFNNFTFWSENKHILLSNYKQENV